MQKSSRKIHILLGVIFSLPLIFSAITGMGYAVFDEILKNEELGELFIQLHTLEIIGLEKVYPIILGISLICLACTGLYLAIQTHSKKNTVSKDDSSNLN